MQSLQLLFFAHLLAISTLFAPFNELFELTLLSFALLELATLALKELDHLLGLVVWLLINIDITGQLVYLTLDGGRYLLLVSLAYLVKFGLEFAFEVLSLCCCQVRIRSNVRLTNPVRSDLFALLVVHLVQLGFVKQTQVSYLVEDLVQLFNVFDLGQLVARVNVSLESLRLAK